MLSHRSLLAWQRARELTMRIALLRRAHWKPWTGSFWSQLQRAALSVQLNIAEGYALPSRKRFLAYLGIAHASSIEVLEVVELLRDLDAIESDDAGELQVLAEEVVRLTLGLLKRYRGHIASV